MMPMLTEGWKRQAALVRADGIVELHTHTAIDLNLALVVHPGDAEDDLAGQARRYARRFWP